MTDTYIKMPGGEINHISGNVARNEDNKLINYKGEVVNEISFEEADAAYVATLDEEAAETHRARQKFMTDKIARYKREKREKE